MIQNFDGELLTTLGISADSFDAECLQWIYKFKKEELTIEFCYACDRTVSTSLFYQGALFGFFYASGLQSLDIEKGNILGVVRAGELTRILKIDPVNITVEWKDL
ncbi:hypothetical protein L3V59_28850 [Burkholderia aenigmatica]|uniref:hypothetical protein n=1 Tax=Burkholderia aenigmatica TaxID=2015348 RepID=UPI001F38717F|nr:hypothetical protein [Burkholderia aenigmatica]UKD13708.1 hypothetical protein L3V59_28850 [Burkholderia aenigmatica]